MDSNAENKPVAGQGTASPPDDRILRFIGRHRVMPVETEHALLLAKNPAAAGSVVLESKIVGRLQGLQFQGTVSRADASSEQAGTAKNAYLKRFPFAAVMLSDLWVLRITRFKYTDNTLGFGTKLHWPARR